MLQNHPWLVRRNLGDKSDSKLPSMAVGYLLVCLAVRPHLIPDEVVVFLATQVLAPRGEPTYH
jgi:hypothetical protein